MVGYDLIYFAGQESNLDGHGRVLGFLSRRRHDPPLPWA